MSKTHCTASADTSGWRFELTRRSGLLFAREERLSLADWPAVAADHPGAALLLSLLDTEDAQPEGDHALIAVGTRQFLIPDPLYSALEAIDAVNAASGDPSPDGLDRRMVAYAHFQDRLTRLTGDVHASDYLRGLTIHHATGLGIDLEPGDAAAPFQPTLYGDCPQDLDVLARVNRADAATRRA